jgi:glycine/D-amino acid oxidase-like deaminating enzyme
VTRTTVDAAVIGAGALGASTAYHLAARGLAVRILEQFEPASQTSPRAAGLSTTVSRDPIHGVIAQGSAEKIANMGAEIGHGVRFVRSGTVRLTRRPELAANVREEIACGARQGIAVEELDASRASHLAPFLASTEAVALTYAPDELYVRDPGEIARSYVKAAEDLGAVVERGYRVDGIDVGQSGVAAVRANGRSISAGVVVMCANAGNGRLARMVGLDLPTVPMRHQLCISEPLPHVRPEHPQVKIVDGRAYVRPHGDRLLIGGFERKPLTFGHEEAAAIDARQLPLDATPLEELIRGIVDVIPALRSAVIAEVRGGIVSMTPDGRYVLDRVPDVPNAWIVGGDNAGANTTSPMIGAAMAEWIVDGAPSIDLAGFEVTRFGEMTEQEATSKAVEEYVEMIARD